MHHDAPVPGRLPCLSILSSRLRRLGHTSQRGNRENSRKQTTNPFHQQFLPQKSLPISYPPFFRIVNYYKTGCPTLFALFAKRVGHHAVPKTEIKKTSPNLAPMR
jgi:hypothetical protein